MKRLRPIHYRTNDELKGRKICAIYFLFLNGSIVYIGKSTDLKARMSYHKSTNHRKFFDEFSFIKCDASKMDLYERRLIRFFKPKLNCNNKDTTRVEKSLIRMIAKAKAFLEGNGYNVYTESNNPFVRKAE